MKEKSGWQLCSNGPEAYEKYMAPAFGRKWARDMVTRAALQKNERILDVGCGTGIVSRTALDILDGSVRITGIDINEIVLEKARTLCPPDTSRIEWKQADATDLPFPAARFDVALCQQGLQYFANRSGALSEINRVLVDKGRVVFSVWRALDCFPFYSALHRALEHYVDIKAATSLASAFTLGDSEAVRELFTKAGFKDINIRLVIKQMRYTPLNDFLMGGFAASPFAADILALDDSKREEMFQMIKNSISDYMDDEGLAAPMESLVVSAHK